MFDMSMSQRDQADLTWYLGEGMTMFFRSPFGGTLQRQMNAAFDSTGHRIPRVENSWQTMVVAKDEHYAGYTVADIVLTRFARVSRRLRLLEASNPLMCSVLEAYYGDSGARWGREKVGRLFAVYPLTKGGKALIASVRKRFSTSVDIRDDELIGTETDLQLRQPNDMRRKRLEKIRDEAEALLLAAHKAWKVAA